MHKKKTLRFKPILSDIKKKNNGVIIASLYGSKIMCSPILDCFLNDTKSDFTKLKYP